MYLQTNSTSSIARVQYKLRVITGIKHLRDDCYKKNEQLHHTKLYTYDTDA